MAVELTLPLEEKTLRKLKALAMLSGKKVSDIESELADMFDLMLTDEIGKQMAEIDGISSASYTIKFPKQEDPQENVEEKQGAKEEGQQEFFFQEDPALKAVSHELSSDEDNEENKSLAEQAEELTKQSVEDDEIQFPQQRIPNAGSNAEAFLDAAMGSADEENPRKGPGNTSRGYGQYGQAPRGIAKAFDPRRRQAKISEYTEGGDEDEPGSYP